MRSVFAPMNWAPPLFATFFALSAIGSNTLEAYAPPWPDWVWDSDRNSIHDILDQEYAQGNGDNLTAAFWFADVPTEDELSELRGRLGSPEYFHHLYALPAVLANATTPNIINASDSPGVIAVDYLGFSVHPSLDVAARALKVRPSNEYSPNTVREAFGANGTGLLIGIMDSGVDDHRHESLRGKYYVGGWWLGTSSVTCVNPQDSDHHVPGDPLTITHRFHGTGMAGIALGTGGLSGTYQGIAPGALLADLRVSNGLNVITSNAIIDAYDWAIGWNNQAFICPGIAFKPIDVISLSLGSLDDCGQGTMSSVIENAFAHGIVTVHAAGNGGDAAETIAGPSAESGTIHVGAVTDYNTINRTDDKSRQSSSRGFRCADADSDTNDEKLPTVGAPGTDIWSPTPVDAMGDDCETCYKVRSGTSPATPQVAGVVASMLQVRPCLKPTAISDQRIRNILINTTEYRVETEGQAPQHTGTGYFGRSWNNVWGYGYVDAYEAVRRAQETSC